ncbi:hypothetical protein Tco_0384133, partial [Tanacetum coccineum]
MSCKRILAITNVVDRPEFLISIIGNPSVHPPARIPHVPDIGDDGIIVFTRVNAKRSAITHSRHSNVEQKDIVAAVQQVSPFAKHLRHTIATHNAYVFL